MLISDEIRVERVHEKLEHGILHWLLQSKVVLFNWEIFDEAGSIKLHPMNKSFLGPHRVFPQTVKLGPIITTFHCKYRIFSRLVKMSQVSMGKMVEKGRRGKESFVFHL